MEDIKCYGTTTMGERGQVVIPKPLREEMKIKDGDKFIVFSPPASGIFLVPSKDIGKIVDKFSKKLTQLKKFIK